MYRSICGGFGGFCGFQRIATETAKGMALGFSARSRSPSELILPRLPFSWREKERKEERPNLLSDRRVSRELREIAARGYRVCGSVSIQGLRVSFVPFLETGFAGKGAQISKEPPCRVATSAARRRQWLESPTITNWTSRARRNCVCGRRSRREWTERYVVRRQCRRCMPRRPLY